MSTAILYKYKKAGVTGVAGVTFPEKPASKGSQRNAAWCDVSHRHTTSPVVEAVPVTPDGSRKSGVTNRCDAESLAAIGFSATVTPDTPVTPERSNARKFLGGAR